MLVGIFDVNPVLEGIAVRGIEIQMISDLPFFLKENNVEIAILTLPKNKAIDMADILIENGIKAIRTNKLEQPAPNLMDLILGHKIDVVIDTPPQGVEHQKDGFVIRRNAIETGVNVLTSLDTAEALVTSLENTDLHNLTLIDIATIASR